MRICRGIGGLACWPLLAGADAGAIDRQQPWLAAVPALLLALAAAGMALAGVALVWRVFVPGSEEGFSLRWQVGGFGAPARGWRLSTPLTQLLAGLALVALAVALGLARVPVEDKGKGEGEGEGKSEAHEVAKPPPNAKTEQTAAEPAEARAAASAASH